MARSMYSAVIGWMVSSTRTLTTLLPQATLVPSSASNTQQKTEAVRDMVGLLPEGSVVILFGNGLLRCDIAFQGQRRGIRGLQCEGAVHLAGGRLYLVLLQIKPRQHEQGINVRLQAHRSLGLRPCVCRIALLLQKNRQLSVRDRVPGIGTDGVAELAFGLLRLVLGQQFLAALHVISGVRVTVGFGEADLGQIMDLHRELPIGRLVVVTLDTLQRNVRLVRRQQRVSGTRCCGRAWRRWRNA